MEEAYLTKEGFEELQKKLNELKTVRRREVAEAIHTAKEQGDLSENAEYVNAKEEQRRIEEHIAEMEATIKSAHVITHPGTGQVNIGNTVLLNCNGEEITYRIVGSNEADPMKAKISNESPVGRALIGKKKGDQLSIPTPVGDKDCQVIDIQ